MFFFLENAIFVNLDGKIEIFNKELTSTHILGDIYYNLVEKLKPLFKKLVKKNVNPNDSDKENIFKIFETIQTNTYNSIIELIPTKPPLKKDENSQKTVINYPSVVKKIKKKCQHNIFLEKFIQTQMFGLYLDEFYYHKGFDI